MIARMGFMRGLPGRGISASAYDPDTGVLTLTYTDGSTFETEDLRGTIVPGGQLGQMVGYDINGDLAAIDPGAAGLPAGDPGQVLGYDELGVPGPVDPRIPLSTTDW